MSNEGSQKVEEKKKEGEYDDDVDALRADEISRDKSCTLDFEIYEDYQHIKLNAPNILGSIGEFCAAFYHVPGTKNIRPKCCLDEGNCKVGNTLPRSVAALVKYEIKDGNDIIVRYSNHYIPDATKHAEEFFSDDIKNTTASSSVSGTTLERITMYITSQPCHLSTTNTPDKSCCNVLLELLGHPRLNGVEICIKPTHIYKAGEQHRDLEKQGRIGIWQLKRIERSRSPEWKKMIGRTFSIWSIWMKASDNRFFPAILKVHGNIWTRKSVISFVILNLLPQSFRVLRFALMIHTLLAPVVEAVLER